LKIINIKYMLATMYELPNFKTKMLSGSIKRFLQPQTSKLHKFIVLSFVMLFAFAYKLQAQTFNITSLPAVVCDGNQVTISYNSPVGLNSGEIVTGYVIYYDNPANVVDSTVIPNGSSGIVVQVYDPGVYNPFAVALTNQGRRITSPQLTVTVYNRPRPGFSVLTQDTQCFRGNNVCFQNLSVQAPAPSTPIKTWIWEYGDAVADSFFANTNPCHSYAFAGTFVATQRVIDSLGCFTDTTLSSTTPVIIKPPLTPSFRWTRRTGPCFISNYLFTNTSPIDISILDSFTWDFGDGNMYAAKAPFTFTEIAFFDTIGHDYTQNGEFPPALIVQDQTGCIDSIRYKTGGIPSNIVFEFDVVTTKSASNSEPRDSVCVGSQNVSNICFKQTPITQAASGTGDFTWVFDDPPSMQRNFDIVSWNPCHQFTGMGTYFVTLTIRNVCPTPFTHTYFSAITLTGDKFIDKNIYANNDALDPESQPRAIRDTIIRPLLKQPLRKLYRQDGFFLSGKRAIGDDTLYVFKGETDRPLYYISNDALLFSAPGVLKDTIQLPLNWQTIRPRPGNPSIIDTFAGYDYFGYGVRVIGPFARIEKPMPPPPVLINASQKNQCGPRDTVDFVNTSLSYKSRKVYRIWDFDDDFAPQCTAFSVPKQIGFPRLYPPIVQTIPFDSVSYDNGLTYFKFGPDTIRAWSNARQQYDFSDHYFIMDGRTYQGKMNCKFSYDTLPRHHYPNWDTVYRWYAFGKDFMPWSPARYSITPTPGRITVHPADTMFWGKAVFLNPSTGEWSLTQGTGPAPFGLWDRIDTINFQYNNSRDLRVGEPINYRNLPDPFNPSLVNPETGVYPIFASGQLRPTDTLRYLFPQPNFIEVGDSIVLDTTGGQAPTDTIAIAGTDILPNSGGETFYEYAFKRTITRCPNVSLILRDSFNNETTQGAGDLDSLDLEEFDCEMEANVQLALARADARGLGKRGRECPGASPNGPFFELGGTGAFPGVVPNCGQTFVLFNFDSLADRMDLTPCSLDGFVTYTGGPNPGTPSTTPGGRVIPPFFSTPNFMPIPWTSPSPTTIAFHYGLNAPGNVPPPADTAQGWITVGLLIGSGCKDTTIRVPVSQYRANISFYGDANNAGSILPLINGPTRTNLNNSPVPGAPATYDYNFSQLLNFEPFVTGFGVDTFVDIEYTDCKWPKCLSDTVWYHKFLRINNITSAFDVDPVNCILRHKGEDITVHYQDSVQDRIKYSLWAWGDGTVTVDSFYYAPSHLPTLTDGYFINGVRRVRYNWDVFDGDVLLDSTVWPVRASGIGATDGLKPGVSFRQITDSVFYRVYNILSRSAVTDSIIVQDKCSGIIDTLANADTLKYFPFKQTIDTALMFLPVTHKFVRTSWEVSRKQPESRTGDLIHVILSEKGCVQVSSRNVTIGFIDTFDIRNSDNISDTLFCENEPVHFVDSLRYFRYDCQITELPFVPAVSNSPSYFGPLLDFPHNSLQIDSADFWRQDVGDPRGIQNIVSHPPYKGRTVLLTVVPERVYWDFGDGSPIDSSVRPVHRYKSFGRYTVTMISRDSLGFFDTCVGYLNISKPVAKIAFQQQNGLPKVRFNCGDLVNMFDSSTMDPTTTLTGSQNDSIKTNYWWFGDDVLDTVNWDTRDNFSPTKFYKRNGTFVVKLVSESYLGCRDTTFDTIFVQGPRPEIALLNKRDTIGCAPFTVFVKNLADSSGKELDLNGNPITDTVTKSTVVYWGDRNNLQSAFLGRRDTLAFTYDSPGVYTIFVYGSDAELGSPNQCDLALYPDTPNMRPITITVLDAITRLALDKDVVCVDQPVTLQNTSDTLFLSFSYLSFKDTLQTDSVYSNQRPPSTTPFTFADTGFYRIISQPDLIDPLIPIAAQANCRNKDTLELRVIKPSPIIEMDTAKTPIFTAKNMTDTATNSQYEWLVRKAGTSTPLLGTPTVATNGSPNFNLTFDLTNEDTGTYEVCLTSFAKGLPIEEACSDSVCKTVTTTLEIFVEYPNVFSPNGDGINDNYVVRIKGELEFSITIYNRWGAKMFETTDPKVTWNGKSFNEGADSPSGVYYYVSSYKLKRQENTQNVNGTITLIR
jgi:gliding motility-associated-like protein